MTGLGFRLELLPEPELLSFIRAQRWFGSKARTAIGVRVLDIAELRAAPSTIVDALVEVRFESGAPDVYQLVVGAREQNGSLGGEIASADGLASFEAFADPLFAHALVDCLRAGEVVAAGNGSIEFRGLPALPIDGAGPREARALGVEQSNSSLVLDDELIVKAYRRVEAGVNPEVELLDFFGRHGFENVPKLWGWWAYDSPELHASLGVVQQFVPGAFDGWSLALEELGSVPETFLRRLRRLGGVIGEMHAVLAAEPGDPAFAPEQASPDSLALLAATVAEQSDRTFHSLPDGPAVASTAGRADEVRDFLQQLGAAGSVGALIRTHGDLHLGQLLWSNDDWLVIDFEGEPARPLPERRLKQSPLRDVAGMLRSFGYATAVAGVGRELETEARDAFLDGYWETVRVANVLPSRETAGPLLQLFELEKAIYELGYELENRPDWVAVPARGIERLLEESI